MRTENNDGKFGIIPKLYFFQQFWDSYPLLSTLVSSAKVTINYPGELTMLPGLTVAITNRITKKNIYYSKDSLKTRNHRAIGCV